MKKIIESIKAKILTLIVISSLVLFTLTLQSCNEKQHGEYKDGETIYYGKDIDYIEVEDDDVDIIFKDGSEIEVERYTKKSKVTKKPKDTFKPVKFKSELKNTIKNTAKVIKETKYKIETKENK